MFVPPYKLFNIPLLHSTSRHNVFGTKTDWTTVGAEFESRWDQQFSLLHVGQTGSGVHPTSHLMVTGGSFLGG
jgi:hypothetical protein